MLKSKKKLLEINKEERFACHAATEDCRQLAASDWRKGGIRHAVARRPITANTVNFSMKFLHSRIPHTCYSTCYVSQVGRAIAASTPSDTVVKHS